MIGSFFVLIITVYIWIVIIEVGLSWLIAFEIVNKENDAAKKLTSQLSRFTDPAYKHLRKYIPPIGGIDISPLILIIGLNILAGLASTIF